jgi:hypothetical protein
VEIIAKNRLSECALARAIHPALCLGLQGLTKAVNVLASEYEAAAAR